MNYSDPIIINKEEILPGEEKIIRFRVGVLPSDTRIHLNIQIFRSKKPGPVVLVLAGMHGDEINGVEIVRRALHESVFKNLNRGSVIAIPVLNIYGFNNFSRELPDGKDVNRSFPGSVTGSLASRVARIVSKRILPYVDFGMDFHTGGGGRYNHPQIRYSPSNPRSAQLAKQFGAPVMMAYPTIRKSLRRVALDAGIPIIVYEGGENLRYDGFSIERGLIGIKRVLAAHEMIQYKAEAPKSASYQKSTWIRASRAGMFRWLKCSGQPVSKGEPLGLLTDPYGSEEVKITSKHDGFIIGHNNAPVVTMGDALFHIAYNGA